MSPNQISKAVRNPASAPTSNQMYWVKQYAPHMVEVVKTTHEASLIIQAFSNKPLVKGD